LVPFAALADTGAASTATVWVVRADDTHQQVQRGLPQIVKALDDIAREKEAELQAEKRLREYIASQCRAGKLKNRNDCANVGVMIPEAGP